MFYSETLLTKAGHDSILRWGEQRASQHPGEQYSALWWRCPQARKATASWPLTATATCLLRYASAGHVTLSPEWTVGRGGVPKGRKKDGDGARTTERERRQQSREKVDDLRPSSAPATSRARGGVRGAKGTERGASAVYAPPHPLHPALLSVQVTSAPARC